MSSLSCWKLLVLFGLDSLVRLHLRRPGLLGHLECWESPEPFGAEYHRAVLSPIAAQLLQLRQVM